MIRVLDTVTRRAPATRPDGPACSGVLGVIRLVVPVALLALLGCSAPPEPWPTAPPSASTPAPSVAPAESDGSLRLQLRRGVPFVQVQIGDLEPQWFVIDTGAALNVISTQLAERLPNVEWVDANLRVTDPNKKTTVIRRHGTLPSIVLGKHASLDVPVSVFDLTSLTRVIGRPIAGILGIPFFVSTPVTLDFPHGRLTLGVDPLEEGADGVLPLRFHPTVKVPLVPVRIAGGELSAILDTGSARGLGLPTSVLERLQLREPIVTVGKTAQLGGIIDNRACRIAGDMLLGEHVFEGPVANVSEQWPRLGSQILKRFAITIDGQRQLVRFVRDSNESIVLPGVRSRGVAFLPSQGGWAVAYVLDSVPAAKRVHSGDRVVAVNGTPVGELGRDWQSRVRGETLQLELARGDERYRVELPLVELIR